ncbi:hypothetical protein EVAR_36826_1 [Eumeta japonica]|uniref:Tesmin/TSO1-like CXC domain-containing protein n=1 Tax=Eumeta variegata TaxID=151549 RepID=A0A4C1WD43_EUMVA|nr:hypothetical protein EVAR_36826_1 [Eumeta japonica]
MSKTKSGIRDMLDIASLVSRKDCKAKNKFVGSPPCPTAAILKIGLKCLRYKQFAKAVTKSTFNLSSLPPTQDTARFHTFRVYHQVQSWLGNYNDLEDWGWKKCGKLLMPVQNSKPPAPSELLKLIFCKCKGNCGAMCGCRKAGMKYSAVCFHCSGETCSNVMELSELINENDFDDEPPTLTPLPSPVLPLVFNSETRSDAEPLPGPSKRLRTE